MRLAARRGVLMAAQGAQPGDAGLDRFLADMRVLNREPTASFGWMCAKDLLGNNAVKGFAQKRQLAAWHEDPQRATHQHHLSP